MKQSFALFIFIFLFTLLPAQQSVLIKITPPGSSVNSYVFATNEHSMISNYSFETKLSETIKQVNAITFDYLLDESQREKMFGIMQFKGDNALKKTYKREDNIRYELMVMDKLKSDVQKFATTQPLYIMQLFRDKDLAGGIDYQNNTIFQLALNASKPVLSILNIRLMEEIMNSVSFETQAAILSNYVNNEDKYKQKDDANLIAYLNGDVNTIAKNNSVIFSPDYVMGIQDKIVERLFSQINNTSTQQSTLFIINANFLGGENGCLKKLEDAGYRLEPIYFLFDEKINSDLTTAINNEQYTSDNFPGLEIVNENKTSIELKIFKGETNTTSNRKYKAIYDPFNDLLDMKNSDTAFVKNWNKITGTDGNCSITIPVKAEWENSNSDTKNGIIKNYSYSGNHAKSDLYYSIGYTIYPPAFDPGDKAEFFNDYINRQALKLKGNLLAQRIISNPDYVGREFTIVVNDSFFVRSKIILRDNIIYQLLCGGPSDNAYSVYANTFFNSFKLESKIAYNWFAYENGIFNCNLPTTPLISSQPINTKYGTLTLQTFSSEDYKEGISYLISVYLYPPKFEFGNENSFLEGLVANAEQQYVGHATKTEKVKSAGMNGRYTELQLNNNKIYKVYFFIRGQTVYQYLAGGSALAMQSENPTYFFNTFTFTIDDN